MFGKDTGTPGESKLNSIIGKGSNCEGDIVVAGGIKVDGNFRGTIKADAVFVGKDATLDATIDANVAVIGGKVIGDVIARQSLELQGKAELVGNIQTKNLIVAETAILDGYCDMGQRERHATRVKKETAAPAAEKVTAGTGAPPPAAGTAGATPTPLTFVKGAPAPGTPAGGPDKK